MSTGVTHNAVVFFDGNIIVKEMLYPEFEAILDGVVGIHEFRDKTSHAVFVQIDASLHILAAVFFVVDFDSKGYADKSWNIPLHHLAESAGRGPDLGAGRVKLSCRSQCSVSWHQRSLWDPVLEDGDTNTLNILAKAITRNRLGLPVEKKSSKDLSPALEEKIETPKKIPSAKANEELENRLKKKFQEDLKSHTKNLIEEHKLRLASMKIEAQDHLEKIQANYRDERKKLVEKADTIKQLFNEEKHKNIQLKKTLDSQADSVKNVRERYFAELEKNKEVSQDRLLELEEKYELEAQANLDAMTADLKERLDMREVELFYRDEQIKRLTTEVEQIRAEKQDLIDNRGDRLLQKLVKSGITFVSYQPGSDHLTIPLGDMSNYLDSPVAYVAEKYSVDEELYKAWLEHFELPICNYSWSGGFCAKPIPKVDKPSKFIVGESDCCSEHNRTANTISEILKVR